MTEVYYLGHKNEGFESFDQGLVDVFGRNSVVAYELCLQPLPEMLQRDLSIKVKLCLLIFNLLLMALPRKLHYKLHFGHKNKFIYAIGNIFDKLILYRGFFYFQDKSRILDFYGKIFSVFASLCYILQLLDSSICDYAT